MADRQLKITSLPTRYEPLVRTFGERAKNTFVAPQDDLVVAKRMLASAESAGQSKLLFVKAQSGSGKSTFVQSLEVFLSDQVDAVARLPQPHELLIADVPGYLAALPQSKKFTVVNFDGREAPYFNEPEYQTFLGSLNGILRARPDLLVLWPVNDAAFAEKLVTLMERVGGRSAFGPAAIHDLQGLRRDQYRLALEKLLQVANWRLEDAAISPTEVEDLIVASNSIGSFLDGLQRLVAERFDVSGIGVDFPTLAIVISSGDLKLRETCRSLRRADSFYIEASRLVMYTKKSNVAEWWANRSGDLKSALPHVIALFNAQLVTLSASSVVHSILHFGNPDLQRLIQGVQANRSNARRVISSSELFKFVTEEAVDNREYGSNVKDDTVLSYERVQKVSDTSHLAINTAILRMIEDAGKSLPGLKYESSLVSSLQTDAVYKAGTNVTALEFRHKAGSEASNNKLAIYILEKLKEYAINFGLAQR